MTSPHDEGTDESPEDIRQDEESAAPADALFYGNVNEFVTDRFIYLVARPAGSGRVWCREWYRHAEALSRLDSVWRAWEALRHDPATGMSSWWLHHVDPHLRALMDPVDGTFAGCADVHQGTEPLPIFDPPEGLFKDQRQQSSFRNPLALD